MATHSSVCDENPRKRVRTSSNDQHKSPPPHSTDQAWKEWSSTYPNIFTDEIWADREHNLKVTFPDYIKDAKQLFSQINYHVNSEDVGDALEILLFQASVQRWCSSSFDPPGSDPLQFRNWILPLWLSWKTLSSESPAGIHSVFGSAANLGSEHSAHDLIRWAFQLRMGAGHVVRAQAPVVGAPIHELTSSAAATIDLPFLFATEINGAFRSNILSWSWSRTGGRVVEESVITFLLESSHGRGNGNWVEDDLEHKASERRLVMGLYTAQRQRRALRMTDGFVFGALLSHAVMDIYVAYWRDDTLVVDRVFNPFRLGRFSVFVECFFVLCKIADFQREWLADEFARWNEEDVGRVQILREAAESETSWRDGPFEKIPGLKSWIDRVE